MCCDGHASASPVRAVPLSPGTSFPHTGGHTFDTVDVPPEITLGPSSMGVITPDDTELSFYGTSPRCSTI